MRKYSFVSLLGISLMGLFVFSCNFFQSGLGSEMRSKLDDEAGRVSLSSDIWYYPGSADMDMSQSKAQLALQISKKAAVAKPDDPLQSNGLTGAFTILYSNTAGKQTSEAIPFKGGVFNSDYSVFYLDTSPVLAMMKPEKNPSGKGLLELTIAGFVNNEDGDQKGRPLAPLTKTVDFQPLFPSSKAYFSSSNPNMGRSIEIPLNAPVTFTPQADFIITGGNYPSDLLNADFDLSLSPDGLTILLTPKKEFYNREFDFYVDIKGFIPPASSLSTEFNVHVFVTNSLIVLDGVKDELWNDPTVGYAPDPLGDAISDIYPQPGNEITGMYVLSDPRNLYVALEFASLSNMWEQDRIGLLIDKKGTNTGDTTDSLEALSSVPKLASKMTFVNGTAYVYFVHLPGASAGRGNSMLRLQQFTVENDTSGTPSKVQASQYGWVNPNGPHFLEYRFALNDIGLETGDTIRIFGVLCNSWDSDFSLHSTDIVPGGPAQPTSRDVIYDFNNAFEYTLGVGPNYTQPEPDDFIAAPSPSYMSVSEMGPNGVRLTWRSVFSADYYHIYRSDTADGVYARIDTVDWPVASGIDWNVTPGATYFYKVKAVNGKGESDFSAPVQVTIPASGDPLSKVHMDNGTLDVSFYDPRSTVFTDDTKVAGNETGGNFTIERMYITSDDDNMYVALDFGTIPPRGYARTRFVILVDNPDVPGVPINIPPIQMPAYSITIATASGTGNINQFVFKQLTATTDGGAAPLLTGLPSLAGLDCNAAWKWTRCFDDWQYYVYNAPDGLSKSFLADNAWRVIKFKIPKANIGITSAGQKVRV
ncbi:MAG: fibronectin type III domain-containing protein, partial [Treponema sp.]|nr:fibronectin type III domain-containing protein [Treponema sp.]